MTESLRIRDLTFTYPEQPRPALEHLSLTVEQGEFLVLCGPSGCGKSTLLRQLKAALTPHGARSGQILLAGRPLEEYDQRAQSQQIGFVQQSPEHQIVTDKVWHELAFGLESLGYDSPTIRRRVAEMASFFGIQTWFYDDVAQLSGGQKQLLNLAAVMVLQPGILILDEPTSQLDPIAAADFLATVGKINRELGTTVLLTEHRLEEALPLATRMAVMDRGAILATGDPYTVGRTLRDRGHAMFLAMPTPMRVWAACADDSPPPITVREGRDWLADYALRHELLPLPGEPGGRSPEEAILSCQDLWFRYGKELPDVVKGLSLTVNKGELLALLGGNGTGKTTSLKLLGGLLRPCRGEVRRGGSVGLLPQDPQSLFEKATVREDLYALLADPDRDDRIAYVAALCRLTDLLDRHPYDLSGGEQQRAALAKVLLLEPEILLMDEPTKGLDAEFKQVLAEILQSLLRQGVAVLMVSHDIEFCARYAHRCALFFDGGVVTQGPPRSFFSGNSFYTTSANRMARDLAPQVVTAEELITVCGGSLPAPPPLPEDIPPLPPPPTDDVPGGRPTKLPRWRKLIAAVSAAAAAVLLFQIMGVTDLTALLNAGGMTNQALRQLWTAGGLCVALLVFAFAVSRRSVRPEALAQPPAERRRLSKRTLAATVLILLLIPLTLLVGEFCLRGQKYYFIMLLVLLECMIPFFLIFEGRKPQARELVILAVLCALGIAGRAAALMLPQFKPVIALTIVTGIAFGGESGFLVGAMTMLTSNMLLGQTPLTPWQMFAMGIIGFLAGVLFRKGVLRRTRVSMCVFGALASVLIYGGIMNPASALMWTHELNRNILLSYYISGFPFDLIQSGATWLFLWVAGEPLLEKLDRVKVKYGLVQ